MITFTPLAGSAHSTRHLPLAYLLQVDDVNILLDCGSPDWHPEQFGKSQSEPTDAPFWETYCRELERIAPSIDLVLLSHGDLAHSGLFTYAFARWGLTASTYTTLPVQAMARIATLEEVTALRMEEDVDPPKQIEEPPPIKVEEDAMEEDLHKLIPSGKNGVRIPTIEEVNDAFASIITLRYSQPTHLTGKCQGITITPFAAGHTIGGTAWKIRSPSAGTLLYAVNLNHLKERHLDGSVISLSATGGIYEPIARPDLLITDAERTLTISCRRKERDRALLDLITHTLSSGHSLLLPTDSSARLLELLVLTDQHWAFSKLRAPICLISKTSKELLTVVRSMMEWLGGTISKEDVGDPGAKRNQRRKVGEDEDEALGALALRFKFVELFGSPSDLLHEIPSKTPKLILAVPASLSHGPSRALFADFAAVQGNVIVLTGRSEQGTLSHFLMERWEAAQEDTERWQDGKLGEPIPLDRPIQVELRSKIPLQGEELTAYLTKQKADKEREANERAALARKKQLEEEGDDNDDSEATDSDSDSAESDAGGGGGHGRRGGVGDEMDWELGQDEAGFGGKQQMFDIMVKPPPSSNANLNAPKGAAFFKAKDQNTVSVMQRVKMFPYAERRRRMDDFGEIVDVNAWLRKGKMFDEKAEDEGLKELRERRKAETAKKDVPVEVPSKYVTEVVDLEMRCKVFFVDLEGVHDGRATKNIIPHINPRRMIVVQATEAATDSLLQSCAMIRAMTTEIYHPKVGEAIRIGEHMHNFTLALSDALMASVKMSSFEDSEIGFVKGRITIPPHTGVPLLEPLRLAGRQVNESEGEDNRLALEGLKPKGTSLPRAMMVGDLKLTALKSRLNGLGIGAEFAGEGVLVCRAITDSVEDTVAVRKTGRGEVRVEGGACEMFYTVRDAIYQLHALVEV